MACAASNGPGGDRLLTRRQLGQMQRKGDDSRTMM